MQTSECTVPREVEREPLRLRLDNGTQSGPFDGAWWPQSRDLASEAADLVDHFPKAVGRVSRLLFSRPAREAAPDTRQVTARRGPVEVGSFPSDDTHVMIVRLGAREHLRLLVVPPGTDPDPAERIMAYAADAGSSRSAAELLDLATPGRSRLGFDIWEDDGGA